MNEEVTRKFKKRDAILILVLLVIGIVAYAILQFSNAKTSGTGTVRIQVDGETYAEYDLGSDQEIPIMIDGEVTNTLEIKDGYANMIDAECPDQLCVHQSKISKKNETIICLPNKVVVEIVDGEESAYDTMVR